MNFNPAPTGRRQTLMTIRPNSEVQLFDTMPNVKLMAIRPPDGHVEFYNPDRTVRWECALADVIDALRDLVERRAS